MKYSLSLTGEQLNIIESPLEGRIFLEGPAGVGKTTAGVERLLHLMASGISGHSILTVVPQRTLAAPYFEAISHPGIMEGGMVSILTIGGLARRSIELFWPLIAAQAGFHKPDDLPVFLTLETAQYYIAHLVRPLLETGLFDSVTIDRNRLYSQIIDNLNKAAVVGFNHSEIGERLQEAWVGEPSQLNVYQDVQTCSSKFREYCLTHNLLDFSLQIEVFRDYVWSTPLYWGYLSGRYQHLIVDNLEEDTPVAHDLLAEWLSEFTSVLLIYDHNAGFRRFLGADSDTTYQLKALCDDHKSLYSSFVTSPDVEALADLLASTLPHGSKHKNEDGQSPIFLKAERGNPSVAFQIKDHRYYPQMLDWVAEKISELIDEQGFSPADIVVMAPYLSDALRFSLINRLEARKIPVQSHRPSRSLREEPATQCLITLAMLAHPEWDFSPTKFDLAYALIQAIDGMDLVRAQLLVEKNFHIRDGKPQISSFDVIGPEMQERITYRLGERFEQLRQWLSDCRRYQDEFDHFLSRLFGEVLSQPGYGFHKDLDAGKVAAVLVESVEKFRWAAGKALEVEGIPLGKEYIAMVKDGVIAAQYIHSWRIQPRDAVLVAPAYTFLMRNQPVKIQFWLDVGSRGWYERLYQPLTQPYVLSREWKQGRKWTDVDEVAVGQDSLFRLTMGLLRRCEFKIYLGISELGENGYEHRGPLMSAFQRVLRSMSSH